MGERGLVRDIGQLIRDWLPAVALITMVKTLVTEGRVQSRREEIANSVSSGIGLLAIIGGIPFLLGSAIQFWLHLPFEGLLWIAAGGLAYSTGVVFYLAKQIRYTHFVWHLFVAAGTACHFCAVFWYAG